MKKNSTKPKASQGRAPSQYRGYVPPAFDAQRLAELAEAVLAGTVVITSSVQEFCALMNLLKEQGHDMLERTEYQRQAAPFLFYVG